MTTTHHLTLGYHLGNANMHRRSRNRLHAPRAISMEMTEQKLYTLVKSGVRQWFSNWYARLIAETVRLKGGRRRWPCPSPRCRTCQPNTAYP